MTKDLTEQWKKGELESGEYWCKNIENGKVYTANTIHGSELYCEALTGTLNIGYWEVLAPVPSYEEWQKMKEQRDACAWALDKIGDVLVKHKLVKK